MVVLRGDCKSSLDDFLIGFCFVSMHGALWRSHSTWMGYAFCCWEVKFNGLRQDSSGK